MKYTIEAQNNDERWIEEFNDACGYDFSIGEEVDSAGINLLKIDIDIFNYEFANGLTVWLERTSS